MWFEDLRPWRYLSVKTPWPLLAVGWLERGKAYAIGKPDADTFAALSILYQRDQPTGLCRYDTSGFFAGGSHRVDDVVRTGRPDHVRHRWRRSAPTVQ